MHVDGFRFDLASALAREFYDVDRLAAFFELVQQDPIVSQVKLIAEPWDVGPGGYQVGNFPPQWSEWNGKYRDTVRDFWRGEPTLGEFASRLAGSSDLYEQSGRRPFASINFVTAHDGFTLRDLVSYNDKHNEENGEENRDGTNDNRSWNCGAEGETSDPAILTLRAQQARNLLSTLLLSTGTPMMTAGDEMWRTQGGNNNAYCLDNEVSWVDWTTSDASEALLGFTQRLIDLRSSSPALRQPQFFEGRTTPSGNPDLVWFRPDGQEMAETDWFDEGRRTLGMFIDGSNCLSRTRDGELVSDDSWLMLMHAGAEAISVTLPHERYGPSYEPFLDTTTTDGSPANPGSLAPREKLTVPARSLLLLRIPR
jgi:glycogen operon protein